MPTNCEITFDNNEERVYYGGQSITGHVHLTLSKEKIIRGNIRISKTEKLFQHLFL